MSARMEVFFRFGKNVQEETKQFICRDIRKAQNGRIGVKSVDNNESATDVMVSDSSLENLVLQILWKYAEHTEVRMSTGTSQSAQAA